MFLSMNIFYFQAEDGIRDLTVTGVQTCALPISRFFWAQREARDADDEIARAEAIERLGGLFCQAHDASRMRGRAAQERSEERRVGKEVRLEWKYEECISNTV